MNALPSIIQDSGMYGPALVLLGLVVLFLTGRALWWRAISGGRADPVLETQANAVLFWGGASVALGFLGQCQGTYLALNAILAAPEISPDVVAQGFVISFVPTLFGLGIFAFSVVAWATLRFLPSRGAPTLTLLSLALFLLGCGSSSRGGPTDIMDGVWALRAEPSVFLWEFGADGSGRVGCVVHELTGGLKFMETPCTSVEIDGMAVHVEMPNGTRYEGRLNLAHGRIDGRLEYMDGGEMDAPLEWEAADAYPSLYARDPALGPYAYGVPQERGDGIPVEDAGNLGVDPAALEGTVDAILRGEAGFLKSILVLRAGKLILEEYFHGYQADDLAPIMSCTKSISSILVGLAIKEGRITGVDVPILEFFPEDRGSAGAGWDSLTLEHLLTMSLALDWTPEEAESLHGTGPSAFRQILARDVVGRPGEDWAYVNMNVNLLAGILFRATGDHAEALAARGLFGPLGVRSWDWGGGRTDGFNLMDGSLWLRPRDMAKIGLLMMNGGEWQGTPILDEAWVKESLTPRLSAGPGGEGYGYLWWTMQVPGPEGQPLEMAFANGGGSQFIFMVPELDLVIVTTGGNQENGKHLAIGKVLTEVLLPGVGELRG